MGQNSLKMSKKEEYYLHYVTVICSFRTYTDRTVGSQP